MEPISILHLEDSAIDADLVRARLQREGLEVEMTRVDTHEDFVAALKSSPYDLILADHSLPGFNGAAALDIARNLSPATPFIFVSATLGEELAVDCLKRGATDYVLKHRMERLGPAVRRALDEAHEREQRRRATEALRESETRFRQLADAMPQIVYVTRSDGFPEFLNQRWTEYAGPATDEPYDVARHVHPEDLDQMRRRWKEATAAGVDYESEFRLRRADGAYRWFLTRAVPIRDASGTVGRWFGTSTDIDDTKRARDELERLTEESERRRRLYETVMSSTPDLVYVFDLDHRFTYANEALLGMWGRSWSEAIGKNCLELGYEPWHAAMHDREIDEVVATKRPIRGEVPFNGTNGRRIYDYIFVPVLAADGEVEAVAGTTRDVTDRKRDEEALRDADRRKDQFLATLAHELRNPLAPISNALQAWSFIENDPAELDRLRQTMTRQVGQMTRLIDDLLDVSRITRGKISLRKERADLGEVIEAAVEGVKPQIDARRQRLSISIPIPPPVAHGDVARLVQVFSNLLHNAAKYTSEGGRIDVSVRVDPGADGAADRTIVTVTDDGAGIPPEMLSRVFDIFVQVDQTLDRSHGGLGIGLTLVKTLVELHGGTVEAKSGGTGQGSTFVVTLPLAEPIVASGEGRPTVPVGSADLTRFRILVVDDMRPSARTLALMLKGLGQETQVAHDGAAALAVLDEFDAEVVLLDIAMPGMDGYEACRRIRDRPGRQPLLVALTGYGGEEDRRRAFEAGFDRHLVKPTSLDSLRDLIAGAKIGVVNGEQPD